LGIVCIALNRPTKGSNSNTYRAAFASYSPSDDKPFSKSNARNAAIGRILNWRTEHKNVKGEVCETNPRIEFQYINNTEDGKFNLTNAFDHALMQGVDSWAVPSWVGRSKCIGYGLNPDFGDLEQIVIL
jgi:hypothetical protein